MILALKATEMKTVEFANSAEPHEAAHNEPLNSPVYELLN